MSLENPFEVTPEEVSNRVKAIEFAELDASNRAFEEGMYASGVILSAGFVLSKLSGVESLQAASNWSGGLAFVALMSAAIVSPDHRSMMSRLRGLKYEFMNPEPIRRKRVSEEQARCK